MTAPLAGVTPDDLRRALVFLPRTRFQYLLRKGCPVFNQQAVLRLALYDWFAHLGGYISDDQQQRVVAKFEAELAAAAAEGPGAGCTHALTLSDGRYAAVTGRDRWYDYELDEDLAELPGACVTHVACDLTALQLRLAKRLADLRGGRDAGHADPGRAADGPR